MPDSLHRPPGCLKPALGQLAILSIEISTDPNASGLFVVALFGTYEYTLSTYTARSQELGGVLVHDDGAAGSRSTLYTQ